LGSILTYVLFEPVLPNPSKILLIKVTQKNKIRYMTPTVLELSTTCSTEKNVPR
jgi:hypothetical protein